MVSRHGTLIRLVGVAQLAFGVLLAAATIFAYTPYRSTLGDFTRPMAAAIASASDVLAEMAETIKLRQKLLNDSKATLIASKDLVKQMKVSAEVQRGLLPIYERDLRNLAWNVWNFGKTLMGLGGQMQLIRVPNGVTFPSPIAPQVSYWLPLQQQAVSLTTQGQQFTQLGSTIGKVADSVLVDGQKLNAAFSQSFEQAIKLLDNATATMAEVKGEDLPKAIQGLQRTSQNLREVSRQVEGWDKIGFVLLGVGLVLAGLCILQSIGMFLIASVVRRSAPSPA